LIFVGVTDKERNLVGVSREGIAHMSDGLAARLASPSWQPEMFEVPLDDRPDRYVVVIRIDRETAPRPVFVEVTAQFAGDRQNFLYAPVRMPGGSTRQATRDELYALFIEERLDEDEGGKWDLNSPRIPDDKNNNRDITVDFVILTGLRVPAASAALGRPISGRAVDAIAAALDGLRLPSLLMELTGASHGGLDPFRREGFNRSYIANLVWRLRLGGEINPFEMNLRIEVPGHYGLTHGGELVLTLQVVSRLTAWQRSGMPVGYPPPAGQYRRLEVTEWAELLESVTTALTFSGVVVPVADLAGIDPIVVRQPRVLHLVTGPPVGHLLPSQLAEIRGAGQSHGASVLGDPALDLSAAPDRQEQIDRWLNQIGADAGMHGMERLILAMRQQASGS
jgi:hypothetical protein